MFHHCPRRPRQYFGAITWLVPSSPAESWIPEICALAAQGLQQTQAAGRLTEESQQAPALKALQGVPSILQELKWFSRVYGMSMGCLWDVYGVSMDVYGRYAIAHIPYILYIPSGYLT